MPKEKYLDSFSNRNSSTLVSRRLEEALLADLDDFLLSESLRRFSMMLVSGEIGGSGM